MEAEGPEDGAAAEPSLTDRAGDFLARYQTLVLEYESLREALRASAAGGGEVPGLGPHISLLKNESAATEDLRRKAAEYELGGQGSLDSGPDADGEERRLRNRLLSSNLPAHETHWNAVKKCRGVVSLNRWVSTVSPSLRRGTDRARRRENNVLVNAVVDGGAEWLRVLTTTQHRLLLEMAASGWDFGNESDDEEAANGPKGDVGTQTTVQPQGVGRQNSEEDSSGGDDDDDDDNDGIPLLRIAADLVRAARCNPCEHNYARPRVHILLSRIAEGDCGDVDSLLRRVRRLGRQHGVELVVDCANSPFHQAKTPAFATCLPRLLPDDPIDLTPTINVDTSILVALASDISHRRVAVEPWQNRSHAQEIRNENDRPGAVLATILSKLGGRRLVCTREAASSLAKLVRIIGTPAEQTRATLLLPRDDDAQSEAGARVSELRELSIHPIPDEIQLPVQVVDEEWGMDRIEAAVESGELPSVALRVAPEMTKPTVSVFSYGWASGNMTITANGSAKRQIARLIDKYGMTGDARGPNIWAMEPCRSLNGRKKER